MPDPQRDLAPLTEPLPASLATAPDFVMPLALGLGGVLLIATLLWWWRCRAPLRALRRLATSADPRRGADELARLLPHLAPAPTWLAELDRLRFGRLRPDDAATLACMCHKAATSPWCSTPR